MLTKSGDRLWRPRGASRMELGNPLAGNESRSVTFTTEDFDDGEKPDSQQKREPVTGRRARDDIGAVREHKRDRAPFYTPHRGSHDRYGVGNKRPTAM